jgi:hypothetical protein
MEFLRANLPWSVTSALNGAGGWSNPENVTQFQNKYNDSMDATAQHFLKRGWGSAQDVTAYQNE